MAFAQTAEQSPAGQRAPVEDGRAAPQEPAASTTIADQPSVKLPAPPASQKPADEAVTPALPAVEVIQKSTPNEAPDAKSKTKRSAAGPATKRPGKLAGGGKSETKPAPKIATKDAAVPIAPSEAPSLSLDGGDNASGEVAANTSILPTSPKLPALIGSARSGSETVVGHERLEARPVFRGAEILEAAPGLVTTQHSGEGKANQYFLRGFNLDHGTDLAITVDGMPINMRTHGHGQGYADMNFLIPEVVRGMTVRKGPYFADEGDFASAGAAHITTFDRLDANFGQVSVGSFGHRRAVAAASAPAGAGSVIAAGEVVSFDGPWQRPDELLKLNGLLRYSQGSADNGVSLTGMAYRGDWFSTDQIPLRAVQTGLIDRLGTLDPTDGGSAERISLSGNWNRRDADSASKLSAYAIKSDLSLFSNFTYLLDNPIDGDQFQQTDRRTVLGFDGSHRVFSRLGNIGVEAAGGIGLRYDDISVALAKTRERQLLGFVRRDDVSEASVGSWAEATLRWTDWLRTTGGIRYDWFAADVSSDTAVNSGQSTEGMWSPKAGLALGPVDGHEVYLNAGRSFHSNDVRGTTIVIDPASGDPAQQVPLLVQSRGAEIGWRHEVKETLTASAALFVLDFDSEILFVGDAGTTEASRPSRRVGAEVSILWKLMPWLTADIDIAYTRPRSQDDDLVGRFIPGAVEGVASIGLVAHDLDGWSLGARWRYFGQRPLIEDNSVRSKASYPLSAFVGYRLTDETSVRLDAFNILDQRTGQIDYYYQSRLSGEGAAGADDVHFHPLEPRSFRLSIRSSF